MVLFKLEIMIMVYECIALFLIDLIASQFKENDERSSEKKLCLFEML